MPQQLFSIFNNFKNYFTSIRRDNSKEDALKLLKRYGYSPDHLYTVNTTVQKKLSESGEINLDKIWQLLRFFKFPMSLGYLIENRLKIRHFSLDNLRDILKYSLLQSFESYPLHMDIDQEKWDFYKKVDESTLPIEVQLNITNRCINRCKMCRKYKWPQIDIPIATVREIVKEFKKMRVQLLIFSGGEPFLHHDFEQILDITEDMPTLIFTSGTVPLSFEMLKKLKRVQFSLDAIDPEIYQSIRGRGNVETVKKNILNAKEAGCDVTITTVIQNQNILHVPDIIEFCEKEHIFFLPSVVHSYDDLAFYNIKNRLLPPLCIITFYHCLIDPAGDVFVCCHHHEDNTYYERIDRRFVLGNIFHDTFSDIWFSDRAKTIKNWLLYNRAPFCEGCYRYLLENDAASFIRSCSLPQSFPYKHTYFFPLEIMAKYRLEK